MREQKEHVLNLVAYNHALCPPSLNPRSQLTPITLVAGCKVSWTRNTKFTVIVWKKSVLSMMLDNLRKIDILMLPIKFEGCRFAEKQEIVFLLLFFKKFTLERRLGFTNKNMKTENLN